MSVGDADASTEAQVQLPLDCGQLLTSSSPFVITASGGDHASGAWGFNGTVAITFE